MDVPIFIEADLETITAEMVARFEELTGKTLQPAHPERLMIDVIAYREYLIRTQVQEACLQNLVDFANAPMLDYLGALVNVYRNESLYATTVILFTTAGGADVFIPKGTKVSDGSNVFETIADLTILSADTSGFRSASAVISGPSQNGIAVGEIDTLVDSVAGVLSVYNTLATIGGDVSETDDMLRTRIKESPSQYATTGSKEAYKYWIKTLQPLIIDAEVIASSGVVTIYPLMYDGSAITPGMNLELVSLLSDEKYRPLTDVIQITSPTKLTETVDIELTLLTGSDATAIQSEITELMDAYCDARRKKLGLDATEEQIIAICMRTGVYDVDLTGGFVDQIAGINQFVDLSYTLAVIGTNNG